jgi:hypothetical protein
VDYSSKAKSCKVRDFLVAKNSVGAALAYEALVFTIRVPVPGYLSLSLYRERGYKI